MDQKLIELERNLALRLAAGENIDSSLILSLKTALQVCEWDSGGVYLVDNLSQELYLQFSIGLSLELTKEVQRYSNLSDRWKVAVKGKPVFLKYEQLPISLNPVLISEGIRSVAWVPMVHQNQLIGGILLLTKLEVELSKDQKFVLETISAQTGLNIARIRAREELSTSVNRYLSILNKDETLIFVLSFEGHFLFTNLAFQKVSGYSSEQLIELTLNDLLSTSGQEEYEKDRSVFLSGNKTNTTLPIKSKEGTVREISTYFSIGMWDFKNVLIGFSEKKEAITEPNSRNPVEAKFLIDLFPIPAIIINPISLMMIYGNKEFQNVFGYSESESKKVNFLQLFAKNEYDRLIDHLKSAGLYGLRDSLIWTQIAKDKTVVPTQLSIHPLRWLDVDSYLVVMNLEAAQNVSVFSIQEDRYREVVNKQSDLIVRFTMEGMITFVNQAYCDFLQKTAEQLIGRPVYEQIPEQDVGIFQQHIKQISIQTPSHQSQNRLIDGLGRLRTVHWVDRGVFEGNDLVEIQGEGRDISDSESARILKQTMEQRFRVLVEEIQGVVYVLHAETMMVIYMSPQIEKLSGYSQEEVYKNPLFWFAKIYPDDVLEVINEFKKRITGVSDEIIEFRFIHKDGRIVWVQDRGAKIVAEDGTIFLQGIMMDVSASQNSKQKLENYSKLGRMINDFSLALMTVTSENWDKLIIKILTEMGIQLSVDRSYLFMIDYGNKVINNTHEWCAEGIQSSMKDFQNRPIDEFNWWFPKLSFDGKIIIEDLDSLLPEESNIREMLESQSAQSVLIVAMKRKDHFYGCLGFDSVVTQKHWDEEIVLLLRMFSDMLMSTYERINPEKLVFPADN